MPSRRGVASSRRVALVLLLALLGVAGAQCTVGPEYAEVTLPDFLAVYYQDFRSEPQEDRVVFYGGVCVTAVGGGWTVTAPRVTVTGLTGELELHSDDPTLYLGQWQITAAELESTVEKLTLQSATVVGPDVSGNAKSLTVDLVTSEISMSGLELNSLAFAVSGRDAVLRGELLSLEGAGVTTCIGLETPPYELEGMRAEVDLGARSVVLSGGMLRLGGARFRLQEEIVLSEESLAAFELPVQVQNVSGPANRPGTGLGIRLVGVPLENDVELDIGATGIDTDHPTGAVALLRLGTTLEDSTLVEAGVGLEAGRPYLEIDLTRPLASWLDLELGVISGAMPGRDARHEAHAALSATVPVQALRGSV